MTTSTKPRTTPMSTIEEMVETFLESSIADSHGNVDPHQGMRAVIEKHIGPMLAEAFAAGDRKIPGYGELPEGYAARILSALTATGRE